MAKVVNCWTILMITSSLWASSRSFSCPKSPSGCTCFDTNEGATFLCPTPVEKQFSIRILDKKKLVKMQCEQQTVDLLPNLTLSSFQSFTMEGCSFGISFEKVLGRMQMRDLRQLTLRSMPLRKITKDTFRELPGLETLEIRHCLASLNSDFLMSIRKLRQLSLRSINLLSIAFQLNVATKLQHLDLSYNGIKTLANRPFRHMPQLELLSLENNALQHLAKEMFEGLGSLSELDLSGNRISLISRDTFADLPNLTRITLAQNRIAFIHSNLFSHNVLLEEIWLQANQIQELHGNLLKQCAKLQKILLNTNRLGQLPANLFHGLGMLEKVDISGNNLTNSGLPEGLFSKLTRLKSLDLSNNPLNNISLVLFSSLDELLLSRARIAQFPSLNLKPRLLDLSFNNINHIEVKDLLSSGISRIDLSSNQIQHVEFNIRKPLGPVVKHMVVNLEKNPISCDCPNYALIGYNQGAFPQLEGILEITQSGLECSNSQDTLVRQFELRDIHCRVLDNCPAGCQCSKTPATDQLTVDCSGRNLTSLPRLHRMYDGKLKLDLSGNWLERIDWLPADLQELNLEGNLLKNLDAPLLASLDGIHSLERLYLKGNPWQCNCQSQGLQRFIQKNFQKLNSSDVFCQNTQVELISMKLHCSSLIADLLPLYLLLLICLATTCALYYRYQMHIKIYLYAKNLCLCLITEDEVDRDKTYDIFISYSNKDEAFVMQHLVPELEKSAYRLCIHGRDWVPGKLIMDQISCSVQESRRTLVVLSNGFLESVWGKMEFRIAQVQGRTRVIVVVCDDLDMERLDDELKNYLKSNTYLRWGERYFWNKLKYALPHSRKPP